MSYPDDQHCLFVGVLQDPDCRVIKFDELAGAAEAIAARRVPTSDNVRKKTPGETVQ